MKNGAFVTKSQLDSASINVQRELHRLGLWNDDSRLHQTEVIWCRLPQLLLPGALGFFLHTSTRFGRLLGYYPGYIYIPQWVFTQGLWSQRRGSLRDVVRHEYAHAIAHHYPSLVERSTQFTAAFGGTYSRIKPIDGVGRDIISDYRNFVSDYATTRPMEDFAETFMFYVRLNGKLPIGFDSSAIKRKWRFIEDLVGIIDSGGIKW